MECKNCKAQCIKAGVRNNNQRYYCKQCKKYQQKEYKYQAYEEKTDHAISEYTKEGCGIRSTARLLGISPVVLSLPRAT